METNIDYHTKSRVQIIYDNIPRPTSIFHALWFYQFRNIEYQKNKHYKNIHFIIKTTLVPVEDLSFWTRYFRAIKNTVTVVYDISIVI